MLDDLPGGPDLIKPALKGYEGGYSPWAITTMQGCTFWNNGLCDLHDLGLKPMHAKLSHHDLTLDQVNEIADAVTEEWETEKATQVIDKWKKITL